MKAQAAIGKGVDCVSTGHPLAWYRGLKSQGFAVAVIDVASPGWERDYQYALQAGLIVLLDQGYYPPAFAAMAGAEQRAQELVQAAQSVGYLPHLTTWVDFEKYSGTDTAGIQWLNTWSQIVAGAGWMPGEYVGVPQPLSGAQQYTDLDHIVRYWRGSQSAVPVATRGYCGEQVAWNTTIDGVLVDVTEWRTDALGGQAMGAVLVG